MSIDRQRREPRKKGLMFYYDTWEAVFGALSIEDAGELAKILLEYDMYGVDVESESQLVNAFKALLKPSVDRDLENYRTKCEKAKEAVSERWAKGVMSWENGTPIFKTTEARNKYFEEHGILSWAEVYPQFKTTEARDKYFKEYGEPPYGNG